MVDRVSSWINRRSMPDRQGAHPLIPGSSGTVSVFSRIWTRSLKLVVVLMARVMARTPGRAFFSSNSVMIDLLGLSFRTGLSTAAFVSRSRPLTASSTVSGAVTQGLVTGEKKDRVVYH